MALTRWMNGKRLASGERQRVAATPRYRQALLAAAHWLGLVVGVVGIVLVGLASIRLGSIDISTADTWNALANFDPLAHEHLVVRSLRLPRTVIALGVGGALAVAGAVMQAVTRNPLADPSILGVSSGATFAVVIAVYYFGLTSPAEYIWFAFFGAMVASLLVFAIGAAGPDGPTPLKLTLAGVVVSILLGAWTSALLLYDLETIESLRFWMAGSVAGRELDTFWLVSPFLLGGAVACVFMGHQLNVLSLGDDTARALGMNTARTRVICSVLVVLITGAAVSTAGPIAFVGLAVPHMVRSVVGPDYRWILPYSLLSGAILLTIADIGGRVIARPGELPVGIVAALFGAPFMIYLARQRAVGN
jgi:iron complex transport system permease protein